MTLLMLPKWPQIGSKTVPGPREQFRTILHPYNKFLNFFQKSKFQAQNLFFMLCAALQSLKKRF
eukprot:UN15168